MEPFIDLTTFDVILRHVLHRSSPIRWVWFVSHRSLLAETGQALAEGTGRLAELFDRDLVREVPVGSPLLLDAVPRSARCHCLFLPPVYLVHLPAAAPSLFPTLS